jgi:hypothetical protein
MALITQLRTDFGDPEEILLQRIKQRINSAVSKLATEHYLRNTEEPTLTARLIQLIEERLQQEPVDVPGLKFEWESQTMGSIGRTEEANSGADIYISIVREDNGRHDSKGMLVQAKRQDSLERRRSERARLGTQCRKMRKRTDDAYVWVFHDSGVRVSRAPPYAEAPRVHGILARETTTPGDLVVEGLRCRRGDRKIGRTLGLPLHEAINDITSRLGAKRWISGTIKNSWSG